MNKLLRVANVIEEGRMGGPQVRIAAVACTLKDRVETTVVMPSANSEAFRALLDRCGTPYKTVELTRITKQLSVAIRYVLFSWWEAYRLARYFRRMRFDLVHVSGGAWQYKGIVAGKLAGCGVIWHLNDTSTPWLFRRVFALFSRLADGYIFASERSRKYYGSLIPADKPEFIIPAPVDTSRFDPAIPVSGDEEILARWEGKTVVGAVGNVNRIKGFDFLIEVAAELNKTHDNLHFVVVGPVYASQQKYYERLVELCRQSGVSNVEFVGARADVRPLLRRFDIYVCTSRAESSPISVWEAMAMAKPIVSTDVGDVYRHIQDGSSGFIVAPGDVGSFGERVSALVEDADLRRSIGARARDAAQAGLGLDRCVQQHFDAYAQVLACRTAEK